MASGASSSTTQFVDLPRIDCPKCNLKVIRCKSKNHDVYYKCPNHFKNGSSQCPYYWYEKAYVEYLHSNHPELMNPVPTEEVKSVAVEGNGDLKPEICELKLQMCEMKAQLGQMMVKIMEGKEEIKEEIAKGNKSPAVFNCQIS